MYKRILVPVDGSETSNRGLKEAIALARQSGAQLRLLHVVDESVLALTPEVGVVDLSDSLRDSGRKVLAKAVALAERSGVKAETSMPENLTGRVSDAILREARKWRADVVVMGTHGRRGLSHMLLGSDAEGVVRSSPVPVLLVRGHARNRARAKRA